MDQYENIAAYYDATIARPVESVVKIFEKFLPSTGKLLDVGCGTGTVLEYFQKRGFEVWGIDNSEAMLKSASLTVPPNRLSRVNMTDFSLPEKFNVILCLYDTVNHLINFTEWKSFFSVCRNHLLPEGIFIFDMNTLEKLNASVGKTIKKEELTIDISKREGLFYWNITTPTGKATIIEQSFPIEKVLEVLEHDFIIKEEFSDSGREYFVCKNKQ